MQKEPSSSADVIDHIPHVDPIEVIDPQLLAAKKHEVAKIFTRLTVETESEKSKGLLGEGLRVAGYSRLQRLAMIPSFLRLSLTHEPHDLEIFRKRSDGIRSLVEDLMDRLMTEDSSIHGAENIAEANTRTENGEEVVLCSNHPSQTDPIRISALLHRSGEDSARDKLVATMGHRVWLDRFQRGFSVALHSVFTLQTKYVKEIDSDEKKVVQAYLKNVKEVLTALFQSPEYLPLIFPEGGLTRNGRIAFDVPTIAALSKKVITPLYLDDPTQSLRMEEGDIQKIEKSSIQLYVGEPFTHETDEKSRVKAISDFVHTYRRRLLDVYAPIQDTRIGVQRKDEFIEL